MEDKIPQADVFILNIYSNENCHESLPALYSMTFPDLCKLHNFVIFRSSLTTLQNHKQFQDMERAQAQAQSR